MSPSSAAPTASPAPSDPRPASASRRRRLWELPPEAHELLLGLGFGIDQLRHEAERVLGRLHRVACELQGSDSDLLYSVVHDMARRNVLSERLQQLFEQRHAAAEKAVRTVRDEAALRALWQARLQDGVGEHLVATFWALLTHPAGPALQSRLLFDLKTRCWQRSRAGDAQGERQRTLEARVATLQAELRTQQTRLGEALQAHQADRQAWALRQAQWNGERARLVDAARGPAPAPALAGASSAPGPVEYAASGAPPPAARIERRRSPAAIRAGLPPRPRLPVVTADSATSASSTPPPIGAAAPAGPANGGPPRHVLCVGGVQHAVPRYREHVERLGARFEHHDGGLEDSLPRLEGPLSRADLVVCQAGCINHEAYHRIKRHCARTGTPCVYLERPSLSRFEAAIGAHLSAPGASAAAAPAARSPAHG